MTMTYGEIGISIRSAGWPVEETPLDGSGA